METVIDKVIEKDVIFDYTEFLSKSCQQRLSFMDALKYLIPLFKVTTSTIGKTPLSCTERLEKKALTILSSNTSDINNLIRLSSLAKQEGIMRLVVYLPYSLEAQQLAELKNEIKGSIDFVQGNSERLLFILD
ncbi:hypothetical protein UB37_15380 [Photobacterium iliopiscarium]|jgi:hypothetical protein|uniref:Uncharacterized protein n=1 Tax=Photobacterium iliopiscarium TaxID=56192 RepID=A0A0D8PSH6_9GAMM|nr:hypothetical protein [Photobacterium iliopiscarium]KJG20109.1 hypothetical protein UB37_15380 [Photobacterium iliopiscarium]MCD9465796.1 hypothetical protein [Photobacterium iliopiscarium]MCD9487275.1 hypothetical protein [Photobacterium iliopiscarium]MCF2242940.1 hypothetical protein [Photobacterium iliopiscarium]PST96587.1 hypothetical protein C9I87_03315 [Photobacterium iliopiscarium]